MGRTPCCDSKGIKKGPWTPEEDKLLVDYVQANGTGNWRLLPKLAGLNRCGKSCRLRWTNYLRPDIKRGPFTPEEHKSILQLHAIVGNKWSMIAAQLPGRTDNEIKNYWNTNLKKQPRQAAPGAGGEQAGLSSPCGAGCPAARHMAQWETARLEAEARLSLLSTSATTSATASTSSSSTVVAAGAEHGAELATPDIYLRLWNSEVGDSFRRSVAALPSSAPDADDEAVANNEEGEAEAAALTLPPLPAGDDSSAVSNVTTALAVDEYQAFLDLAADEIGLLHGRYAGVFSLFSPGAADVLAVADASSCLFTLFD